MYRSAFLSGLLLRIVNPFDVLESQTLAQAWISIKLSVGDAIRAYPLAIGVSHVQCLLRFLAGFASEIFAHFYTLCFNPLLLKFQKHYTISHALVKHRRTGETTRLRISDCGMRIDKVETILLFNPQSEIPNPQSKRGCRNTRTCYIITEPRRPICRWQS